MDPKCSNVSKISLEVRNGSKVNGPKNEPIGPKWIPNGRMEPRDPKWVPSGRMDPKGAERSEMDPKWSNGSKMSLQVRNGSQMVEWTQNEPRE